jgi:hypothetical protein
MSKTTKKYPFGKNSDEIAIYKSYFTTQARNTNKPFRQYEKNCIKHVADYKQVCNTWKKDLGDISKKKFDDPSTCELSLPQFQNKQLHKMSLSELNMYSRRIRDIILVVNECILRRTKFQEKCVPPDLRDTGHEQRIKNVVKLQSHCENQLLKIAREIELKSPSSTRKWSDWRPSSPRLPPPGFGSLLPPPGFS